MGHLQNIQSCETSIETGNLQSHDEQIIEQVCRKFGSTKLTNLSEKELNSNGSKNSALLLDMV